MRRSTLLFHDTQRLLYTKWRDPGEEAKLHLFGQFKRIAKDWLDGHHGSTADLEDLARPREKYGVFAFLSFEHPLF
jgi:hypothetical protein